MSHPTLSAISAAKARYGEHDKSEANGVSREATCLVRTPPVPQRQIVINRQHRLPVYPGRETDHAEQNAHHTLSYVALPPLPAPSCYRSCCRDTGNPCPSYHRLAGYSLYRAVCRLS